MLKSNSRALSIACELLGTKKDDSVPIPTISVTEAADMTPPATPIKEISEPQNSTQRQEVSSIPATIDLTAKRIKASPYTNQENFLDLEDLTLQERLFAHALTTLKPCRDDYATAPYLESFNWNSVFALLRELCTQHGITFQRQEFYAVIFLSRRKKDADGAKLGELDQEAHREACESGGLLTYWFGTPNEERRNLATCIWRNRADAVLGGGGPGHIKAMGAAVVMYKPFSFERQKFIVGDGADTWCLVQHPVNFAKRS